MNDNIGTCPMRHPWYLSSRFKPREQTVEERVAIEKALVTYLFEEDSDE